VDEDDGRQAVVREQAAGEVHVGLKPMVADATVFQVATDLHVLHAGDGQDD
jgi:hypothetical protein